VIILDFNQKQTEAARNLASFAPIFQKTFIGNPDFRKQFEESDVGNYIALEFFLVHFAYAHQGSPKAYPVIAKQVIQEIFHGRLKTVNSNQPIEAWETYTDIAKRDFNGIETNATHNPMNEDRGVLKVIANPEIKSKNIAVYIKKPD
jgi:hypothetical protein